MSERVQPNLYSRPNQMVALRFPLNLPVCPYRFLLHEAPTNFPLAPRGSGTHLRSNSALGRAGAWSDHDGSGPPPGTSSLFAEETRRFRLEASVEELLGIAGL